MNDKVSGNASLLTQISELQSYENKYGHETTAKLLQEGLQRNAKIGVSEEQASGFLTITKALQNQNVQVPEVVKEKQDEVTKIVTEIWTENDDDYTYNDECIDTDEEYEEQDI